MYRLLRSFPKRTPLCRSFANSAVCLQPVKVLFGSQTGTAQGFAMQLSSHLEDMAASVPNGLEVTCVDMYEYADGPLSMEKLRGEGGVVFVVSCFGRGEPTDSAKAFMSWLMDPAREAEGGLQGLKYTVFGLGSSQTHKAYYNVVGKKLDARLEALGASRMYARGEGDAGGPSIEQEFEAWETGLLDTLKGQEGKGTGAAQVQQEPASAAPPRVLILPGATVNQYHSESDCPIVLQPAAAPCDLAGAKEQVVKQPAPSLHVPQQYTPLVTSSLVNLTPFEGLRPIYELRLRARPGEGGVPSYKAGDHVAVQPRNSAQAVERLCARMRWDPSFSFTIRPDSAASSKDKADSVLSRLPFHDHATTVGQALRDHLAIGGPVTPAILRTLSAHASSSSEKEGLLSLASKEQYVPAVREPAVQLVDVLEAFPSVTLPLDKYLTMAAPLMPRYYSISSSPAAHGQHEMHVTFRHLRATRPAACLAKAPTFDGVCSSHMAGLRAGDELAIRVRPSSFTLPRDPSLPIVMIAGGIGVAPFKSFLEDRMAKQAQYGPALLLYGCRDSRDEVYRGLAQQAVSSGALRAFQIGHAVPLEGGKGVFADALVHAHGQEVWTCLEGGGTVYVCGGASGFGQAIAQAVKSIIVAHGHDGEAYMNRLLAEDRFMEDLAD